MYIELYIVGIKLWTINTHIIYLIWSYVEIRKKGIGLKRVVFVLRTKCVDFHLYNQYNCGRFFKRKIDFECERFQRNSYVL